VSKLDERLTEEGNVTIKRVGNCGRKSMLSKSTKLRLCINSKKCHGDTSKELRAKLSDLGKNVTIRTIRNTLIEKGPNAYRSIKMPHLTQAHIKKRYA